jgi:hypothetical protein
VLQMHNKNCTCALQLFKRSGIEETHSSLLINNQQLNFIYILHICK